MIGTIRHLLVIAILAAMGWGCLAIIARHYALGLPIAPVPFIGPWLAIAVHYAGPPALFFTALISWMQARSWRRIGTLRHEPAGSAASSRSLARGASHPVMPDDRPSGLETWAARLMLLAVLALPYWLGTDQPGLWAGGFLAATWTLRLILRS